MSNDVGGSEIRIAFPLLSESTSRKATAAGAAKKMLRSLLFSALAVCFANLAQNTAVAAPQNLKVESGSTKFLAVGRPSFLKIRGEGKGPSGDLVYDKGNVSGSLDVDMTSFTTGIEMRDHHMKEKYLEVGKFPKATLAVKSLQLPDLASLPKDAPFQGDLTLHGVTLPVKGSLHIASVKNKADAYSFNAKFPVKITEYKIAIPSYGSIKVAEDVDVEVDSIASKVASAKPETPADAKGPSKSDSKQSGPGSPKPVKKDK